MAIESWLMDMDGYKGPITVEELIVRFEGGRPKLFELTPYQSIEPRSTWLSRKRNAARIRR